RPRYPGVSAAAYRAPAPPEVPGGARRARRERSVPRPILPSCHGSSRRHEDDTKRTKDFCTYGFVYLRALRDFVISRRSGIGGLSDASYCCRFGGGAVLASFGAPLPGSFFGSGRKSFRTGSRSSFD